MPRIYCEIAGTKHRPIDAQLAASRLAIGTKLALQREPTNKYDARAIQVFTVAGGIDLCIGYVPKRHNEEPCEWLDDPARRTDVHCFYAGNGKIEVIMGDEALKEREAFHANRDKARSQQAEALDDEISF
jgi:hypothetical protein